MLNALLDRIFGVATLAADAVSGRSRATLLGGEPKPISWLALPGFASGGSSGDRAWSIRLGSVVIAFAAVGRPDGEQAGDRTIWTGDGLVLRLREKKLEIIGTDAVDGIDLDGGASGKKVVRHGDNSSATVAFQLWLAGIDGFVRYIVPTLPPLPVPPTGIVEAIATTTKVKAG